MRMVRKQLYLSIEQDRRVRRLAAQRGCTEAAVIRTAIDQLSDDDRSIEGHLAAAGLLVSATGDDDLPTGAAAERFEEAGMAWIEKQREPLGLAEAVLEDRR
jgi:antitoxin ParD1/3/4